eukprot:831821-Prymnesium_polylepis.1
MAPAAQLLRAPGGRWSPRRAPGQTQLAHERVTLDARDRGGKHHANAGGHTDCRRCSRHLDGVGEVLIVRRHRRHNGAAPAASGAREVCHCRGFYRRHGTFSNLSLRLQGV